MVPRLVAILALPGVQLLDVAGPLDVFAEANVQSGEDVYDLAIVGTAADTILTSSGRRLVADLVAPGTDPTRFDTLLVAGAPRMHEAGVDNGLLDWLAKVATQCRRYGSVCSGAFLLGQAGLLDRRRVTTHWAVAEVLAARYPEASVEPDAICLFDGPLRTAAGVTAGLDLALALVEEDLGAEIARRVASQLVMFFRRGGGQMQFSRRGLSAPAGRSALQEVPALGGCASRAGSRGREARGACGNESAPFRAPVPDRDGTDTGRLRGKRPDRGCPAPSGNGRHRSQAGRERLRVPRRRHPPAGLHAARRDNACGISTTTSASLSRRRI